MFDILPLAIILISLSVIISIVVRKFSVLSALDVENIQAEKEARFKEQIVGNRIKRNFYKHYSRFARKFRPAAEGVASFFVGIYKKLVDFKDSYNKEKVLQVENKETIVDKYLREADDYKKSEDFEKAEKSLIEVIALDSQNIKAFKMLGDVYLLKKSFPEAKQTLEHVVKLLETSYDPNKIISGDGSEEISAQLSLAYFDLTLASKEIGDLDNAALSVDKALSIEANNPRYLDTKLEISIMKKNDIGATETFNKLKEVDPGNQKLDEIKKRIDEMVKIEKSDLEGGTNEKK